MIIEKIEHRSDARKATVTLNYGEIRDINYALFETGNVSDIRRSFFLLFELVKNGCIDRFAVEHLFELLNAEAESKAKDGEA